MVFGISPMVNNRLGIIGNELGWLHADDCIYKLPTQCNESMISGTKKVIQAHASCCRSGRGAPAQIVTSPTPCKLALQTRFANRTQGGNMIGDRHWLRGRKVNKQIPALGTSATFAGRK